MNVEFEQLKIQDEQILHVVVDGTLDRIEEMAVGDGVLEN